MFLKATQQWIGSPLGYNIVLSVLKDGRPNVEKYVQVNKNVELRNREFTKEFDFKTDYVIANVSSLQSTWASCSDSGSIMTVYNSFTYTQDIKYEARLLELPLQSGLKLVIVVPNELDVLQNLFNILKDQGLEAAVRSIQPLFTAKCELNAPNISIISRIENSEKINGFAKSTIAQCGTLVVNKMGTNVTVFTCLTIPSNMIPTQNEHNVTINHSTWQSSMKTRLYLLDSLRNDWSSS